jgi:hypothetical protein
MASIFWGSVSRESHTVDPCTPGPDLLATPLDPMAWWYFADSPREFSTVHSDLRDLPSWIYAVLKPVLLPQIGRSAGFFHRDPMLDDVLPPELLLTSDLEDFLSLRRLGLRSFQGMSSWISITLSEVLSLLSFVWFRLRILCTPCI